MWWLHCVGRAYYPTPEAFIREARTYGVTRRVSLSVLKKMEWGDRVLLAMKVGKSLVVFGGFEVRTMSGLSGEALAELVRRHDLDVYEPPDMGRKVKRGCGSYTVGLHVSAGGHRLSELAAELEELKQNGMDVGLPMVGGPYFDHPRCRLVDIPFRQGFRPFDYERFRLALADVLSGSQNGRGKLPRIRGQFYAERRKEAAEVVSGVALEEVRGYERKR